MSDFIRRDNKGRKLWTGESQEKDSRGYSTIHTIRGVIRPAFQMAVEDDLIRKNPFEFQFTSIIHQIRTKL